MSIKRRRAALLDQIAAEWIEEKQKDYRDRVGHPMSKQELDLLHRWGHEYAEDKVKWNYLPFDT